MTEEQIKSELRTISEQINELRVRAVTLSQELARMLAVFKVGDRVTYDGADKVWQIRAIGLAYGEVLRYHGSALKKDGTPSIRVEQIWLPFGKTLRLANQPKDPT